MTAALAITPQVGVEAACSAFRVPRATVYRRRRLRVVRVRAASWRALSAEERLEVLRVLYDTRFVDASPAEVHATLLDEGLHIASVSTMYRILRAQHAVRERRSVTRQPSYVKPELVATAPNQVWSWDITKIRGPERRVWFHLYVIIDIFSRKVVGWMLAGHESGSLAEQFIAETLAKEGVVRGPLTLHSDRGTSMRSRTVAEFLADIGVTKSHSRPRTSNDNPFSEAQFKTMKYCPFFPGSFASLAEAREFFHLFFAWYNHEHHHSGIAMLTPDTVHSGRVDAVRAVRQTALDTAWEAHPERFVHGHPQASSPPATVWINRPVHEVDVAAGSTAVDAGVGPRTATIPEARTESEGHPVGAEG